MKHRVNPPWLVQGDVRKAEDVVRWVQQTTDTFGRLDILVNCAAGNFLVTPPLLPFSPLPAFPNTPPPRFSPFFV